jgi:hypothetical protein
VRSTSPRNTPIWAVSGKLGTLTRSVSPALMVITVEFAWVMILGLVVWAELGMVYPVSRQHKINILEIDLYMVRSMRVNICSAIAQIGSIHELPLFEQWHKSYKLFNPRS